MPPYRPIQERLWEKVEINSEHPMGCHEWTGAKIRQGYGTIFSEGRSHLVHRLVYRFCHGVDPGDLCVMHTCDNPSCCNPEHLRLGTVRDNNADRHLKGRSSGGSLPGENNPSAKITPELAREIFVRADPHADVARELGLSLGTVFDIRRRRIWAHATEGLTCGYRWRTENANARAAEKVR